MVGGYSNEDREAELEELRLEKERDARRKAEAAKKSDQAGGEEE